MAKTVVGMFESYDEARRAATELELLGFTHSDVSMVASQETRDRAHESGDHAGNDTAERTGIGAGVGAAMGGLAGLLVGIGALAIPGVGPLIAAGPIAAALTGAGIGAAAGGLIGALTSIGVPEEHASLYAEGVKRGHTLVTVRTDDARAQQAADILTRAGAVDIERRSRGADTGRADEAGGFGLGAMGVDRASGPGRQGGDDDGATDRYGSGERRIPVYEEQVEVGKRQVESGGVRVSSQLIETPIQEQVSLREEHVHVERRPMNQEVDPRELDRAQGGTVEMTERSEQVVVGKTARMVEEVVVSKDVGQRTETVNETSRRTDVQVEELGSRDDLGREQQNLGGGFDAYEGACRAHWQTSYGSTGRSYDEFQPAYQYGYNIASDNNYRDREWSDIEPHISQHWESTRPGTWSNVKQAVRHAWDQVRGRRTTTTL